MSSEPLLLPAAMLNSANNAAKCKKQLSQRQIDALKRHAFKRGQSGNPSGRPSKPLTEQLVTGLLRKRSREAKRIANAILDKAASGDVAAFVAIADRVEGKPVQRVEGDQAIHITVERVGD